MIVIIDGYNLLKQLFPGAKGLIDQQREHFIRQLGYYQQKKHKEIKEIIVVFDAGPFRHATREIKHGITVVFSGQKSNADNWIIDFTERKKGQEILVITMDRELIESCGKNGAQALSSLEFYQLMQKCILENAPQKSTFSVITTLEKYEPIDLDDEFSQSPIDQHALDLLMEQESINITKDVAKNDKLPQQQRKGSGFTLSKEEKKAYTKIKKLR